MADTIIQQPIPRTGESLPVIGLGTWQTFDVGKGNLREPLKAVLRDFVRLHGKVIDSSPMYGNSKASSVISPRSWLAEAVVSGDEGGPAVVTPASGRWKNHSGVRTQVMDLMQVHNLVDWQTHLATLRRWKERGKVRYVGVTHYTASAYDQLARVLDTEDLDFVQLNYSIVEREAERRLLPLATDKRIAVLVNRPFAAGGLFSRLHGKPLPPWAKEIDCASWAQFLLKFVISHPTVTCAIPATSKVQHLTDNMQQRWEPFPTSTCASARALRAEL
jgi:aryl-alcohol dehydrogenase-like predicted oxidoreductase